MKPKKLMTYKTKNKIYDEFDFQDSLFDFQNGVFISGRSI